MYCIVYRHLYSASHGICQTEALSVHFSSRKKVRLKTKESRDVHSPSDPISIPPCLRFPLFSEYFTVWEKITLFLKNLCFISDGFFHSLTLNSRSLHPIFAKTLHFLLYFSRFIIPPSLIISPLISLNLRVLHTLRVFRFPLL